jgi:3-carboxy-cis,cis-muconate cycloisomerase
MAEALSVALAARLGRVEAQGVVKAASERALRAGITLRQAALDDTRVTAVLSAHEIGWVLDPAQHLGSTSDLIDLALETFRGKP